MASGCHIRYQGLGYSSGTLSNLASKPPPHPSWCRLMGLACSGPPGPIPFHPLSLIPGFWWHSLPPSHQLLLLNLNMSFSLPTVVLWFPAASGEISPEQAQDPQNLQPYLNIHQHPRPRCRCPGEATKEQNTQNLCDQEIPGCLVASTWEKHKG